MDTTMNSRQLQSFLRLLEDKGVNVERSTTVLASGVLADVFDRDAKLDNREAVRAALGLGPLVTSPIILRARHPFDPAAAFGQGWTVWRGSKDGTGLKGDEERAPHSLTLKEINVAQVELETRLRPSESYTTGVERLIRLEAEKAEHIRLDPAFALALMDEPSKFPAAWKGKVIFFDGLTLRSPLGGRCSVCAGWVDGTVELYSHWHDDNRNATYPSALLASKHLATGS